MRSPRKPRPSSRKAAPHTLPILFIGLLFSLNLVYLLDRRRWPKPTTPAVLQSPQSPRPINYSQPLPDQEILLRSKLCVPRFYEIENVRYYNFSAVLTIAGYASNDTLKQGHANDLGSANLLRMNFGKQHCKSPDGRRVLTSRQYAPITMRKHTEDVRGIVRALLKEQYRVLRPIYQQHPLQLVLDFSSTCGAEAIYFATLFNESRVFAVGSDVDSFTVISHNTAAYDNVIPIMVRLPRSSQSYWARVDPLNTTTDTAPVVYSYHKLSNHLLSTYYSSIANETTRNKLVPVRTIHALLSQLGIQRISLLLLKLPQLLALLTQSELIDLGANVRNKTVYNALGGVGPLPGQPPSKNVGGGVWDNVECVCINTFAAWADVELLKRYMVLVDALMETKGFVKIPTQSALVPYYKPHDRQRQ